MNDPIGLEDEVREVEQVAALLELDLVTAGAVHDACKRGAK